ncbi:MAG: hypothetical protein JWN73_1638 [Betaproteobacteria bacterium]|nr:hypothetical protein [Betaproteobacteria bacterium]
MGKNRLEAFSDGVIAVIITIMVLELKAPHDASLSALAELWPVFLSYLLSFVYTGIYWNNHHHLMHAVRRINGSVLWANLHLLFWLSLIPFTTAWMAENHFAEGPVAMYAFVLLMCGVAYTMLATCLSKIDDHNATLGMVSGRRDIKGLLSVAGYVLAIGCAFFAKWVSLGVIIAVALMWFIPDRRIEKSMHQEGAAPE